MPIYGVANNRRQQNRINARRKRDKAVKQFKEDHGVDQREVDAWACRIYFFFGCIPCLILNFLGTVFWEKLLRRSCDADCPTVHEWCGCPQSVVFGDATTKKDYSGMPHCEPSHGGSPGHYWADEAYQLPERPGRSSQDAFELVMAAPESDREALYRRLAAPAEADETRAEEADEKRGYAGKKWPTPGAAAPPPPADEEAPPRDEESPPDVAEFRRLLDVMPEGAVRQRMVLAGLDPNLLDAPDEAPPAVVAAGRRCRRRAAVGSEDRRERAARERPDDRRVERDARADERAVLARDAVPQERVGRLLLLARRRRVVARGDEQRVGVGERREMGLAAALVGMREQRLLPVGLGDLLLRAEVRHAEEALGGAAGLHRESRGAACLLRYSSIVRPRGTASALRHHQ